MFQPFIVFFCIIEIAASDTRPIKQSWWNKLNNYERNGILAISALVGALLLSFFISSSVCSCDGSSRPAYPPPRLQTTNTVLQPVYIPPRVQTNTVLQPVYIPAPQPQPQPQHEIQQQYQHQPQHQIQQQPKTQQQQQSSFSGSAMVQKVKSIFSNRDLNTGPQQQQIQPQHETEPASQQQQEPSSSSSGMVPYEPAGQPPTAPTFQFEPPPTYQQCQAERNVTDPKTNPMSFY